METDLDRYLSVLRGAHNSGFNEYNWFVFALAFFLSLNLSVFLKHVAVGAVEKVMDCESLSGAPVRKCFRV